MHMSRVPCASVVGRMMYTMVCTRSTISLAISVVNKYKANPGK